MNPLDAIMDWYATADDAIRVTRRVVHQEISGVISDRHVFYEQSIDDATSQLEASQRELEQLVVFAMVATFERILREYVFEVVRQQFNGVDDVGNRIAGELERDVEFWKFSDRLIDVLIVVSPDNRGMVKQLVQFRDWVAHGHVRHSDPPINADPQQAYKRLAAFLQAAGLVTL